MDPRPALGGNVTVTGDNPVHDAADDTLGRLRLAKSFAQQVLSLDASEGLVVGVLGAWGSGKTSFINLARDDLEAGASAVLDFNPWMFSGAEQLVESFFIELSAQLKLRPDLAEVGKGLEDYGEAFSGLAWVPLVGPWIERGRLATKIFSKLLQRRKEGVGGRRARLETVMRSLDRPIVVILDDIDRLSTSEIRDVFKLVRLTASFPNMIYVAAFDRRRVEDALGEQGIPGRDYLEKILQVARDLPAVPTHVLHREILTAVDASITGIDDPGPFNESVWSDIFIEIISPLVRNMRDVRRYAATVPGTVRILEGQIALADVLALEAIRVFAPDVFSRLHLAVEGLTATKDVSYGGGTEPSHLKEQVDGLLAAAGRHSEAVRAMITRLFPAAQRHIGEGHYGADWKSAWLKERRVAHDDVLRLYLEGVAGEGLRAFNDAEHAWTLLDDREALDSYLRSLEPERLQDVVAALEAYQDEFVQHHVVPGAVVLLNLLPDLPERRRGMLDLDTRMVVGRVVYRLLRVVEDQSALAEMVREILPDLKTLSARSELITDVGYREGAGHRLVSVADATAFETEWRQQVRSASVHDLVKESELFRTLFLTKREAQPSEPALVIPDTPEMTLALLQSATTEVRSQSFGSRAVGRSLRLSWDGLVGLYGHEDKLRRRIERLRGAPPDGAEELLALVEKYLSGWRPDDFGD